MLQAVTQPLAEEAIPLRLFIRLMHVRIGIVVVRQYALQMRKRDHLGHLCIVIDTHAHIRSERGNRRLCLLNIDECRIGTAFGDADVQLQMVADRETALVCLKCVQQSLQPPIIGLTFGVTRSQIDAITRLDSRPCKLGARY